MRIGLAMALAMAVGAAPAVAQPDLATARSFVERVYRAYCRDCDVSFERNAPRLLSPRLLALVRRDTRLTPPGDVGALDGDPICDCQDFDIKDVHVDVRGVGPGAVAVVRFRNFGVPQTVTLDLQPIQGRWRIDNIHTQETPDLAAFLRRHAGGR